jgi:signal peptidase I
LLEWGAVVLVALLAALGIRQWVFQPFWIPSGSMENTLDIGDRVLVNKLSYHLHPIHRGDVIVFSLPRSWNLGASVKDLIKRVIAVPGDTVYIHDCSVWVNDKKLNEPYTEGRCTEPATAVLDPTGSGRFTVPAKELFVMGDNRTGSSDSRFNGYVPESDVVGRAFVLIWPVGRWRWL